MALTVEQITAQIRKVLPHGPAWSRSVGSTLNKLLTAAADELARVFGRADTLVLEAHPATTVEMLPAWEAEFGLPDPCITDPMTDDDRRAAVAGKLAAVGGQSPQYFIDVAAELGIPITIDELKPAQCGIAQCGLDAVGDEKWGFVWMVKAAQAPDDYFEMGDPVGDPLVRFEDQLLECVIDQIKPAHTAVIYAYEA